MVQASSPTVWRRWLAFELRRLREARDLSQREAGKSCGWSGARVSYIENAVQNVTEDDLDKLLPLYEVSTDRWPTYHEAVEKSSGKGWWQRYDERIIPEWASLYVGLEQGAASIRSYEVIAVPGLLQTLHYAMSVLRTDLVPRTDAQVREEAEIRIARQQVLTRDSDPAEVWTVIDETALHRFPDDQQVMVDQLDHLAEMAERETITIQVLPQARLHGYTFGKFHILGFPWESDPGVVYVEHRHGAVFLEESYEVDSHSLVFQHLCTLAMDPDESIMTIRNLAEELRR